MQRFSLTDPIIEAHDLSKEIDLKSNKLRILNKINLRVLRGQSIAIVGPSGSGKTTLLSLLAGLDVPTAGSVILGGVDIFKLDEEARTKLRAKNIGFVFQNFYLLENLSALENVMLPLELLGDNAAKNKAMEMLTAVGLQDRINHQPRQLSGGEQQRVAIARAFVTNPAILFADEPTGNLDQATGDLVIDKLFSMNKNFSTTLIIITHELSLAERCDHVISLNHGAIN